MPMWNPWHGCHKISTGCKHCYVYREDAAFGTVTPSNEVRKTASFNLPIKRDRKKNWKFPSGTEFALCFTSDFLIEEAMSGVMKSGILSANGLIAHSFSSQNA